MNNYIGFNMTIINLAPEVHNYETFLERKNKRIQSLKGNAKRVQTKIKVKIEGQNKRYQIRIKVYSERLKIFEEQLEKLKQQLEERQEQNKLTKKIIKQIESKQILITSTERQVKNLKTKHKELIQGFEQELENRKQQDKSKLKKVELEEFKLHKKRGRPIEHNEITISQVDGNAEYHRQYYHKVLKKGKVKSR